MKVFLLTLALALSVAAASSLAVHAQKSEQFRAWNQPVEPFRIIGNVYYVGSNEIGVYLITGEDGHILLDGGFEETVDQILANIRTLGFETGDVEILLNSHAHLDHAGGLARLKKETGARLCIMEGDVSAIESGEEGSAYEFPAVPVDCRLQPNEIVELGETRLTAHHTPGHTRGCTTWSMVVTEGADQFDVVFVGSPNVLPDMPLVGNPEYPEIAKDFSKAFATLSSLECDVFLGAHGSYFFLERKIEEMREGNQANPFIDPEHYQDFVKRKAAIFEKKLEEAESKNARESAREFIRREQGLVYGGGNIGLMGVLADEVLAGGGHVTGVILEALARRELAHQGIQDLRVVHTMHERKAVMSELSDGFIAIPGGLGTLEEFFEVLTWGQLGFHKKPVALYNVSGYFDGLLEFLQHAVSEEFLRPEHREMLIASSDAATILDRFASYEPPVLEMWIGRREL